VIGYTLCLILCGLACMHRCSEGLEKKAFGYERVRGLIGVA